MSSAPSSWPPSAALCPGSPPPITSPATPDLRLPRATRAIAQETCIDPALQPTTPTRLLHLGHDQHPTKPRIQGLLRRQTRPRQAAHPSRTRPCPPKGQRALGHAPRSPALPRTTTATHPRRLTNGLRIPCRRHLSSIHDTRRDRTGRVGQNRDLRRHPRL